MFEYFWETVETYTGNPAFKQFTALHFIELALCVVFCIVMCVVYKKANREIREKISLWFVILILADEAFKHTGLLLHGNWLPAYLPLHLCSINIIMITIFHFTKNKVVGNFIYCMCIPGALLAMLFPNWKELPMINFMHLHSLTIHILLLVYPIMTTVGGDIVKNYKLVPKMLGLLAIICIPGMIFNLTCGTNFMFLMEAPAGSPLAWFEGWFGNHLWGFVVLLPIIVGLMYIPYKKVED